MHPVKEEDIRLYEVKKTPSQEKGACTLAGRVKSLKRIRYEK
jgi:hypothetical protein